MHFWKELTFEHVKNVRSWLVICATVSAHQSGQTWQLTHYSGALSEVVMLMWASLTSSHIYLLNTACIAWLCSMGGCCNI